MASPVRKDDFTSSYETAEVKTFSQLKRKVSLLDVDHNKYGAPVIEMPAQRGQRFSDRNQTVPSFEAASSGTWSRFKVKESSNWNSEDSASLLEIQKSEERLNKILRIWTGMAAIIATATVMLAIIRAIKAPMPF